MVTVLSDNPSTRHCFPSCSISTSYSRPVDVVIEIGHCASSQCVRLSYLFNTKRRVNVPKKVAKTVFEGYKKIHQDWAEEQEKELGQISTKSRRAIPVGLQKRLIARAEGKCENCGRSLYNEKIEIHHKNGDSSDNRESNLLVVCGKCHLRITGPPPIRKP